MQFTSPWHSGARSRLDKGWGGGLILSKAQKSAATPALILPVCVVGGYGKKAKSVDSHADIFDCIAAARVIRGWRANDKSRLTAGAHGWQLSGSRKIFTLEVP
ncbi:MAG: hypothetical protein Q8K76_08825 [Rhodoferax sp.]|nr:hypothetical protein [Rhodoferax sp.]